MGLGTRSADFVEEVVAHVGGIGLPDRLSPASGRAGSELGELPEVLGGGGQEEFVPGAVRPSQTQAIEFQDPFDPSCPIRLWIGTPWDAR
jgi:hypothetical protein